MTPDFERYVFDMSDEKIEAMLADLDAADAWRKIGPAAAVEWAEVVHCVNVGRVARDRPRLVLPFEVERVVLECAKRAMHTGKGKHSGRPTDSFVIEHLKDVIVEVAKERQRELQDEYGMKKSAARTRAAQDVSKLAREAYGIQRSAEYIRTRMKPSAE